MVAFVDFGHSKTCITFASFLLGNVKIIRAHYDRNLGARTIDLKVYETFAKEFRSKYGLDLNDSPKAKLKMLDAIEKLRVNLTANRESDIDLEQLMDEHDFRKTVTRDKFEEMAMPVMAQFAELLQ